MAATGSGSGEARGDPLFRELPLKLTQSCEDLQYQTSGRGCGVDVVMNGLEPNASAAQVLDGRQLVIERAPKPVESPHHQNITLVQPEACRSWRTRYRTRA